MIQPDSTDFVGSCGLHRKADRHRAQPFRENKRTHEKSVSEPTELPSRCYYPH